MRKTRMKNLYNFYLKPPLYYRIFNCLFCLVFFYFGCDSITKTEKENYEEKEKLKHVNILLSQTKKIIKSGDIITRTGNDFTSECLRKLCRKDATYSHCGIANIENDSIFIYHALGGDWNPGQKILRESFEKFGDPKENKGIGIFRLACTDAEKIALIDFARDFRNRGIEFDMAFDLKTDNKMYCAEFVAKTIEKASKMSIRIHRSKINDFEFIGVDDIFLNPASKKITGLIY